MKILIAADGSPYTRRVLDYIAAHRVFIDGPHEYVVLHVVAAVPPRAAAVVQKDVLQSYYDDEAEKVFVPIRPFFKELGVQAQYVAKVGHAADVIGHTATSGKFDLIMMGSRGHGSLGSLIMGSVAVKVLGHCETPLLLVR